MQLMLVLSIQIITSTAHAQIDRKAVVERNSPVVHSFDTLSAFTIGNGRFAFTVDATGLQTFPEFYSNGIPLGTQSQWGWHSFPNTEGFRFEETLQAKDFGRGRLELYAVQGKQTARQKAVANYFRANPHRLHLGCLGFDLGDNPLAISAVESALDLWNGCVRSKFTYRGHRYTVRTSCAPDADIVSSSIVSKGNIALRLRFPYPTGLHSDDACDWNADEKHRISIAEQGSDFAKIAHFIDDFSIL